MSRSIHRLTARAVDTMTANGRHADGGGLYLFVSDGGRKRWIFRYTRDGRTREMGLGSAGPAGITLAMAREFAAKARHELAYGRDPIATRDEARRGNRSVPTFREVMDAHIEANRASWRSPKHAAQWQSTLETHAASLLAMPVDKIATEDVLRVLRPIWQAIPETAGRLRGRIETILDSATAQGFRDGANPARWRGHLAQVLPKRPPLSRGHHASMHHSELPAFFRDLRDHDALAARALEVTILTGLRTREVLQAPWEEVDLVNTVWTIPGPRMKSGKPHRLPLLGRALEILEELHANRVSDCVFPGMRSKPLSNMAMLQLLKRMGRGDVTVHGFRATFRTWVSEKTGFPPQIAEMALAHAISDKLEAAYQRGDLFEKRRELMQAWDVYCKGCAADVVRLADVRT
ncbi:MAG: tyrosine-type recombinase/integrase [Rhodobiaceae bacterium]|nr:tyrosine-type recombinase/integrase [Rhodobiaceae bacterium]